MTMVDDPAVTETVKSLAAADDRTFRKEVDKDLRFRPYESRVTDPRDQVRRAALRSPDLVDRWLTTLLMMSKSVEGQLASKQEDHEAEKAELRVALESGAEVTLDRPGGSQKVSARVAWEEAKKNYATARANMLRFKTGLDEWIVEARGLRDALRSSMYDSIVAEERNYYATRAAGLRDAIAEHKHEILNDEGYEPSSADERLWAWLD